MLILYTTEDGKNQVQLRAKDDTVWLTQREMAELFDVSTDNIGLHLKNIYEDEELNRQAHPLQSRSYLSDWLPGAFLPWCPVSPLGLHGPPGIPAERFRHG